MSVDHYENFPVASLLCPARIRPAVVAVYRFARTADDLADEGDAAPEARLAALRAYRAELDAALSGTPATSGSRWSTVFAPLADAIARHALPAAALRALIDAFEQDVTVHRYADRPSLLAYCERSANPVGRLMLHLYGISDAESQARSDAICTALQLANFWQDLRLDAARGRLYPPLADCAAHGVEPDALRAGRDSPAVRALVRDLVDWSESLMRRGAPLVHSVPGRAGIELRLVVQGGLRILEHIRRLEYATLARRPVLTRRDALPIAWRALRMRATAPTALRRLA